MKVAELASACERFREGGGGGGDSTPKLGRKVAGEYSSCVYLSICRSNLEGTLDCAQSFITSYIFFVSFKTLGTFISFPLFGLKLDKQILYNLPL